MDPYNPPSQLEQFYLAQYIFLILKTKWNRTEKKRRRKKETKHNDVTKYNIYSYNVKKESSCAEGVSGLGSCNVVAS